MKIAKQPPTGTPFDPFDSAVPTPAQFDPFSLVDEQANTPPDPKPEVKVQAEPKPVALKISPMPIEAGELPKTDFDDLTNPSNPLSPFSPGQIAVRALTGIGF
jgi:hypothetical protein